MKRKNSLSRTFLWMVFLTTLLPASGWGVVIDYPDFSDLSAFTLGVRTQELNPNPENILRLSSGNWVKGKGYAFLSDPVVISEGYRTQFSFEITVHATYS